MKGFLPRQITLSASFPIIHATDLGGSPSDSDIWAHAKNQSLAIVTKDADFSNRVMVSSPPPWIVHLRFGNLKRHDYHAFLKRVWPQIERMLPAHKLTNVYFDRIEGIRD